jgi:predicted amidohydrolase
MTQALNMVLAQLSPRLRRTADNVKTMVGTIEERPGADLVLFPELFMSGYTTVGVEELAVDPGGPEVGRVARAAKDNSTAVVFGAPERFGGGYANSAFYIDRNGTVAGIYRKAFLFGSEREAYVSGDELLVVDLGGSKAGLMICFDVEFPEVARALAQAGADLLLTISANMDPFGRDHHVFGTSRALENGLPYAYVNQVGTGEEFTFVGGTMAVSADGDILVETGDTAEEVLEFELELPARSSVRPDYLSQLRSPFPTTRDASAAGHQPKSADR